ncbi:S1 RNA-binding domain-containing protein [bacterium]|nr:S1 RNA-binding domain-containing protein [bacterium]
MENKKYSKKEIIRPLKVGEVVEGKVIGIGRSAVYIDLDPFGTGIIYGKEFKEAKDTLKKLNIGDKISAKIIDQETEEGFVELSIREAYQQMAWENIKEKKEKDEPVKVKITNANKGGLLTELFGIPAFLPVSQLSAQNYPRVEGGNPAQILQELQKFIGQEMEVKILDFSPKENKLILSEKAKTAQEVKSALEKYKIGDIIEGEITGISNFGAFIRFGKESPLEGLIHISELDWKLVENPAEIVKVGQKVKAKIINIDNDRVFLSLKALKDDPWKDIEKKYKKGDIIKGKVTRFRPFGALVQIEKDIQGLIHISEFNSHQEMEKTLKIGETYNFKISLVNPSERKIVLKLEK